MDQDAIADPIIEDHTVHAAAAGAIPLPLADVAAVAAIQIDLVRALAKVYEVPFDVATGKAVAASLTGASAARFGAAPSRPFPVSARSVEGSPSPGFPEPRPMR